jgi:hypothetical protein
MPARSYRKTKAHPLGRGWRLSWIDALNTGIPWEGSDKAGCQGALDFPRRKTAADHWY